MVGRELFKLSLSKQIATAITNMHNERPWPNYVDHRHRRAHALHFRVFERGRVNAVLARFKCFPQMFLKIKLGILFQAEAPAEAVEYVRRDLIDSNRACTFAFGLTAH